MQFINIQTKIYYVITNQITMIMYTEVSNQTVFTLFHQIKRYVCASNDVSVSYFVIAPHISSARSLPLLINIKPI